METNLLDNLSRANSPSAFPAGGIVELAPAPHSDALVVVVPNRCERHKLDLIEYEEVVDLITDNNDLWVLLKDLSNLLKFIDGKDLASRVLSVVQDQHLCFGCERPSQVFSVKDPLAIY